MTAQLDGQPARIITSDMTNDLVDTSRLDSRVPDAGWEHVDKEGHVHRWYDGKVPTVETVAVARWYCDDCRDEHETVATICRWCGDTIDLGYTTDPHPQYIKGLERWTFEIEVDSIGKQVGQTGLLTTDDFAIKVVVTGNALAAGQPAMLTLEGTEAPAPRGVAT